APGLRPQAQRPAGAFRGAQPRPRAGPVAEDGGPGGATAKAVETLGRTVYDVPHEPRPWGWRVSAYLWTKSIAAGVALVAGLGTLAGWPPAARTGLPSGAPLVLLVTTVPPVADLQRPAPLPY